MEASEEGKISMLRKAFHSGLGRALEPINQQVDKHARVGDHILWGFKYIQLSRLKSICTPGISQMLPVL